MNITKLASKNSKNNKKNTVTIKDIKILPNNELNKKNNYKIQSLLLKKKESANLREKLKEKEKSDMKRNYNYIRLRNYTNSTNFDDIQLFGQFPPVKALLYREAHTPFQMKRQNHKCKNISRRLETPEPWRSNHSLSFINENNLLKSIDHKSLFLSLD